MNSVKNVLLIIIDDLRPELNCYGRHHVISPNIDALAGAGRMFTRTHCQVPVCGASRASLFTGMRPTRNRFLGYNTWAEKDAPSIATLPEYLKKQGFTTISHGKVFHHDTDSSHAWTQPRLKKLDTFPGYRVKENMDFCSKAQAEAKPGEKVMRGPAFECYDGPDEDYAATEIISNTIESLRQLADSKAPFFLASGNAIPHLPFNAPKRYWDLYDPATIPVPPSYQRPTDVPDSALHGSAELRNTYTSCPRGEPITPEQATQLRHGYLATVSFLDAQIGRILDALEAFGLADDTAVVFAVDHGWNLGEHDLWCKHCLFETSIRVPMIVKIPGMEGGASDALVENLDLFPTICEMLGVDAPEHELQGKSLFPILKNPQSKVKDATFTRFFDGDSICTEEWRYTRWEREGECLGDMLFNHKEDPDERINRVSDPAVKEELEMLRRELDACISTSG